MKNIAIFASGSGTNAENIIRYFSNGNKAKVTLVLSNRLHALVMERAARLGVDTIFFDRHQFYENDEVLSVLKDYKTDLVVLAGFLWLVPAPILEYYKGRIINIHPALLPDFGGKGMYGDKVHESVIESGIKESGISIHYVNERYDSGDIIFQTKCNVLPDDTVHTLATRIHALEYEHYPKVIEQVLEKLGGK